MAPEIPYGPTAREQEMMKRKLPMTPEEALTVVMSDGCSYRVYYKESIRYRPVTEYKMVFEPIRKTERVPVEQINPYTGTLILNGDETTESAFPVLHEKEAVLRAERFCSVFISEDHQLIHLWYDGFRFMTSFQTDAPAKSWTEVLWEYNGDRPRLFCRRHVLNGLRFPFMNDRSTIFAI